MGQFVGSLKFAILMAVVLGGGTLAANYLYYGGIENPFNGSRDRSVELTTLSDRLVEEEPSASGGKKSRRKRKSNRKTLTKK